MVHPATNKKYIKYYCSPKQTKQIRPQILDNIVEDLYVLENVLTKEDTLIVIIEDEPNDTIVEHMKYLYHRDEIFVVIHNMKRLQFNMLNHSLVPKMTILTEAEETEFMNTYKITDKTKIPDFSVSTLSS
jgi:nitrate reductase NapAB chaperone NapD